MTAHGLRESRLDSAIRATAFWTALVLSAFNALSALGGGIGILLTDGLGMPASMLTGGPFSSFTLPGIVLLVVVGGTQVLAATLLFTRRESAPLWLAVAGFGMLVWIFVETMMIRGGSVLQVLYFSTGSVQLILALALLGVVAWLPRAPLGAAGRPGR